MTEGVEIAAQLAVLGFDPLRYLYTEDDFERNLMTELANRVQKWQQQRDRNLAAEIANQVGRLFSK